MPIVVEGPGGAEVEFPDGTPPEVMTGAMRQHFAGDMLDVSQFGSDWKAAKTAIDQLPETTRGRARDRYADVMVANERKDGGTSQTVDDYVRRFAGAVPGLGAWAGEANALASSLTGGDYEMSAAYERAKERAIKASQTTKIATLPLIGDVTAGGLTEAAGTVVGSLAMPMARVAAGAGAVPTAINVGANAAAYGAADAAGNAEPGRTVEDAIKGGLISGAVGTGVGAVVGKIAGRAVPAGTNAIAADAERVGVDLPRVAAGGDSLIDLASRQGAGGLAQIPGVGTPLVRASQRAVNQIDEAATRIADGYSPSPAAGVAAGTTPAAAGEAARDAMEGWVGGKSRDIMKRLYQEVEQQMPPSAMSQLPYTRMARSLLSTEDIASASRVNAPAVSLVEQAVAQGLTFRGMQRLRTSIGAMIDDGLLPGAGTTKPALKRLYEGLTRDMELFARQQGPQALKKWERANSIAADIAERRQNIAKLIGADASKTPEGLIDRLVDMAGTGRSADIYKLNIARRTIKDQWDEVASAAVHRLGRNQADEFSPAVFLRKYSALSPEGRHVLFSSTGKGDLRLQLDSLARVAERFEALNRFANPSGTGRATAVLGGLTTVATGAASLPMMLATAAGGNIMARIMASPVRVRQVSHASQALYDAMTGNGSMPKAVLGLAQVIADETQEDPAVIAERITRSLRGK